MIQRLVSDGTVHIPRIDRLMSDAGLHMDVDDIVLQQVYPIPRVIPCYHHHVGPHLFRAS